MYLPTIVLTEEEFNALPVLPAPVENPYGVTFPARADKPNRHGQWLGYGMHDRTNGEGSVAVLRIAAPEKPHHKPAYREAMHPGRSPSLNRLLKIGKKRR